MSFLRSGGMRLKPKLTLRSLSELSRLRAPVGAGNAADGSAADENGAERAVLAQRVVCAMQRGDDEKPRGGRD